MDVTVRTENLQQVLDSLSEFAREVSNLDDAFSRIGEEVKRDAIARAPKLTGRLAGSIQAHNTQNNKVRITAGAGLEYAAVQEYGWPGHNIEPKFYLNNALDGKTMFILTTIEGDIDNLIGRLGLN